MLWWESYFDATLPNPPPIAPADSSYLSAARGTFFKPASPIPVLKEVGESVRVLLHPLSGEEI
jgi:hypothetical protein